ncbi:MAG: formylglycine-generating enzyme family protein [Phycisphaerales bacterium]|nr:formylglycine-generating enzyme family protein [Phycisphaerales bacterium]
MTQLQRARSLAISTIVGITSLGLGATPQTKAGTFVRSGIEFCEVGAEGNRPLTTAESSINAGRGSVSYSFALSRTEVTVEQFYEFVDAYGRFDNGWPNPFLATRGITIDRTQPSGYGLDPPLRRFGAEMNWRTAARFCNWLHNDKAMTREAFESGAYDTTTFGTRADGSFTDQLTRSPNARFWIPSLDEWLKGAYYDPNRFGDGLGGYWQRPGSRNEFLKYGLPENGGESDAITSGDPTQDPFVPAGSFPQIRSPWALLDTSGGLREMVEETTAGQFARYHMGSRQSDGVWFLADDVNWPGLQGDPMLLTGGLRLATSIPSPGSAVMLLAFLVPRRRRPRRIGQSVKDRVFGSFRVMR